MLVADLQELEEVKTLITKGQQLGVLTYGDVSAAVSEVELDESDVEDLYGHLEKSGIELVEERSTKQPFDPALKLHARIKAAAMERGLICYPGGGTVDGKFGDHVLLAPPFIVEKQHIEQIVDRLGDAIDAALQSVQAG